MIAANVGGEDVPIGEACRADDMGLYDRLSPTLRAAMSQMSVNWNATGVQKIRDSHGDGMALHVLCKVETDMQAAYRARVGL